MKTLITGHRKHKLICYDIEWIKTAIYETTSNLIEKGLSLGLSGMASGVDLDFCLTCIDLRVPYIACPPFEEQSETMEVEDRKLREYCLKQASEIRKIRNSKMVELCDSGIVIFDGNKGGTANVFQQLIEKKKPFTWINPVSEKIWVCD